MVRHEQQPAKPLALMKSNTSIIAFIILVISLGNNCFGQASKCTEWQSQLETQINDLSPNYLYNDTSIILAWNVPMMPSWVSCITYKYRNIRQWKVFPLDKTVQLHDELGEILVTNIDATIQNFESKQANDKIAFLIIRANTINPLCLKIGQEVQTFIDYFNDRIIYSHFDNFKKTSELVADFKNYNLILEYTEVITTIKLVRKCY